MPGDLLYFADNYLLIPMGIGHIQLMMDEGEKEKDDYAPYLTPVWGYLILFLIIIPIVLFLGHRYGGHLHGF